MSDNFKYPRGSEWRKWDLHVHTKGTVKNDQFTSEDFDIFCITFFKKALENNIAVIGVTDYFNIENYKKVLEFVSKIDSNINFTPEEKEKIKEISILPNVELRMLPVTGSGKLVNIHCIFNPNFVPKLDNDFFSTVEFSSGQRKYKMNKQGIIDLGYSLDNSLQNDEEKYKKGIENFAVTHGDLQKLFDENNELKENTITVVSNSSNDGASGFQKHYELFEGTDVSSLDGVRKSIYCLSQLIFSSNKGDRNYFLGKKVDNIDTVKSKCGSLKACIHGSDAHKEEDLFKPDNDNYCWIKADPTFEGLKQIIFEPESRVFIGDTEPDHKVGYDIIKSVQFKDASFSPKEILINKNLTTIIGGKSTGKSILLRNIADAVSPIEVKKRLSEFTKDPYENNYVSEFNVKWENDQENSKKASDTDKKSIIYIPQSYLNRLADETEGQTPIDEIIENLLQQDDEIKITYSNHKDINRENEKQINQNIEDILYKQEDISKLSEEIKVIGDKKGIELEIQKLKDEIGELKKKAGMTDEEISDYNTLVEEIVNLKKEIEQINTDLQILTNLKEQDKVIISDETNILISQLNGDLKESIVKGFKTTLDEVKEKFNINIDEEFKKHETIKSEKEKLLEERNKNFAPLYEKAKKTTSLDDKNKKLELETTKLKEITDQEEKLSKLEKEYSDLIETLVKDHGKFYNNYFDTKTDILKQDIIKDDLEFSIDIPFQTNTFQKEFIDDVCHSYSVKRFESGLLDDYKRTDNQGFEDDIRQIIIGILNGDLKLINSYSKKEALARLLRSWFIFDYKIKQNGDEISDMSPGKKSFVILKLLIELDDSKSPILLDQPEDDLDNRSIYNDLVEFIKDKKVKRQIIIATHNPNLVVGSDAECVIVANQKGEDIQTYNFEYVEGSLENSFILNGEDKILYKQGIQEHVCDVLEGGKRAFEQRKNKYNISFN